ncbi:hypothetical protein DIPPA_01569 [Diplonema papillatum]|nr:hypothetical protein DIPPA_01569 [Diplonema papillatum]
MAALKERCAVAPSLADLDKPAAVEQSVSGENAAAVEQSAAGDNAGTCEQ